MSAADEVVERAEQYGNELDQSSSDTPGQGPESGHTFEITWRSRGSYAVVGEPHHDADYWDAPVTHQVRAWSLREAFTRAQAIPLHVWLGESYDSDVVVEEPSPSNVPAPRPARRVGSFAAPGGPRRLADEER